MCTAFKFLNGDCYFGRNLDLDYNFGQKIVITPSRYKLSFRNGRFFEKHYSMIGMATVADDYPLYADAVNEAGLVMAGLNFPGFAQYSDSNDEEKENVASFEIIPWILGQCRNVQEARSLVARMNVTDENFMDDMPCAPLHWIISDAKESIVIEVIKGEVHLLDNPAEVLTNSPGLDFHLMSLNIFKGLSCRNPKNSMSSSINLEHSGEGYGAIGLPGDYSPVSRFIKAFFIRENSACSPVRDECVSQVFHILDSVAMVKGSVVTAGGGNDITEYSACINASTGVYYYKTYTNSQINAVCMHNVNLDSDTLFEYDLETRQAYNFVN